MTSSSPFDVVVVGSAHMDVVVHMSRRPVLGETVAADSWRLQIGGKGANQALQASAQGARVAMIGRVGTDQFGTIISEGLEAAGVDVGHLVVDADDSSGMGIAMIGSDGVPQGITAGGVNAGIGQADIDAARSVFEGASCLLLQQEISPGANIAAARMARRNGVRVILNAAPASPLNAELDGNIDVLVVNEIEAAMMSGMDEVTDAASAAMAAELLVKSVATILVTLGGNGVVVLERGGSPVHIEGPFRRGGRCAGRGRFLHRRPGGKARTRRRHDRRRPLCQCHRRAGGDAPWPDRRASRAGTRLRTAGLGVGRNRDVTSHESGADLTALSIAEAGPLLASGRVSATALTKAFLGRIRALEPHVNAFVTVTDDLALRQAHAADQRLRDGAGAPLAGIPVAVKDSLETNGIRTTAGSIQLADNVPTQDAAVVERLGEGVLMGKLNLHEWQWGTSSANPFFGVCRNPWDLERTPGGSSGGAGAALAADMCMGAIGSDTGGSIRIPASFCGVVGLKPTADRVSLRGAVPLSPTLDTLGPMARNVRDVALMLGAIAGRDPGDKHCADRPVDDYVANLADGVEGWRVGVLPQASLDNCEPDVRAAVTAAAAVFERAGARLVEIAVDLFDEGRALNRLIAAFETLQILKPRMALETNRFGADIRQRLAEAQMIDEAAYVSALERRPHIAGSFGDVAGRLRHPAGAGDAAWSRHATTPPTRSPRRRSPTICN